MNKELSPRAKTIITIFMLTVLGCMIGWVYEMLFYRIDQGHFIKRGSGFGPWLPIYGFGGLGLTLLSYKKKYNPILVFFVTVIGAGLLEFGTGWFLYHYMDGLRLWDYNVEIWNWGNIGGYVCLRSVLVFGILGVLYTLWAIPGFFKISKKWSSKAILAVSIPTAIIFFSDIIYGYILKSLLFKGA
ncbi:MAG: putative ABC transporter permease [Clostridiales bacterium]|nr:putative ABC transporter permease [Clostridiales bacterium]